MNKMFKNKLVFVHLEEYHESTFRRLTSIIGLLTYNILLQHSNMR